MECNRAEEYKVSVIVPVYRVGKYIDRCMRSLLKQTLKKIEIICICEKEDDAFKRLCGYAKTDNRVHVIKKRNTGVSAARNAGIKAARGTYLAFVDADDWIERYALQVLYSVAERYRAQIIAYGIWPTIEPRRDKRGMFGCSPKRNVVYRNNGMKALFYEHGSRPYIGNKFYNREFLADHHILFDESLDIGEDQLLQFEAFGRAETICFIKEKLYHYDIGRNDSAMNICELQKRIEEQNLKLLYAVMCHKKKNYNSQYDKEYIFWILQQYRGIIDEGSDSNKENRRKNIDAIQGYLEEMSVKKVIRDLPEQYQCLCKYFLNDRNSRIEYEPIRMSHNITDSYMAGQVAGIYEKITVTTGGVGGIRRIYEAFAFHEFRHFIVRVLVRLKLLGW